MNSDINYQVIISRKAMQMLISHTSFLAKVSEEAAEKLIISFEESAETLTFMPQRNPFLYIEYIPKNKYRKFLFHNHYIMLYQIQNTTVYIDYVVDCRQNYKWLIE